MSSRRVPPAYKISDDRQKVFKLLPIPRPKIRAMSAVEAAGADMGPHPVDGSVPWSDLPCLWCDATPTSPYQVDVFSLCHCSRDCASKTLLWLRSVEDERILRESLGLPDDVKLDLKPEPEPTYEFPSGQISVTFNPDGTPRGNPRPPRPGDRVTLPNGVTGIVIQDEGNGKLTVASTGQVRSRADRYNEMQMRGYKPAQVIMDEADSLKIYEGGTDRPVGTVYESEADALRAESLKRQQQAARQIRKGRRGF